MGGIRQIPCLGMAKRARVSLKFWRESILQSRKSSMANNHTGAKENMGKIVMRGIVISGVGTVAWKFIDALTAISLLRLLSLFEYGVYRLALAAYEFMAGFFLAGLENVVVSDVSSYLASDRRRAQAVFSFYIWFVAAVSAAFFLLFFSNTQVLIRVFLIYLLMKSEKVTDRLLN